MALARLALGMCFVATACDEPPPAAPAQDRGAALAARAPLAPRPSGSGVEGVAAPAPAASGEACPRGWTCDYAAFAAEPSKRPKITQVLVQKEAHRLHLVADRTIIRSYSVALGPGGMGHKRYEGDKTTPIGTYSITGRYPSRWHTYLAIDYPNEDDKKRHAELVAAGEIPEGVGPGSAIAIHGHRKDQPPGLHKLVDWTLGCISLDNDEIDEVAEVVPIGTRVVIER